MKFSLKLGQLAYGDFFKFPCDLSCSTWRTEKVRISGNGVLQYPLANHINYSCQSRNSNLSFKGVLHLMLCDSNRASVTYPFNPIIRSCPRHENSICKFQFATIVSQILHGKFNEKFMCVLMYMSAIECDVYYF